MSVCQSVCLSLSPYACLSVCQSVCLFVCLSVSLYVFLSVCLSTLISVISHQQANMQLNINTMTQPGLGAGSSENHQSEQCHLKV